MRIADALVLRNLVRRRLRLRGLAWRLAFAVAQQKRASALRTAIQAVVGLEVKEHRCASLAVELLAG